MIVNFVNKGSLSNDDNIEDPEDQYEVKKYLKEKSVLESNLEEEDIYEAISTVNAYDIFQNRLWDLILT